ncbi:MAG: arginine deiminase family protein [Pseudomonadota bacterium]
MVSLDIRDETSALMDLCVCRGEAVPDCDSYKPDHPEFDAFPMGRWDRNKLLVQQEAFYGVMDRNGVRLHFVEPSAVHPWAMYTRDTAFVIGDSLYFSKIRELPERTGEIDLVRAALPEVPMVEIPGKIEGGDVMPDGDIVFVGLGTRTDPAAAEALGAYVNVRPIALGPSVMHLDTRMTILPGRRALICPDPFQDDDLAMLADRFTLIEVTAAEAKAMATNVFVVNPETVVVHSGFPRIIGAIRDQGLNVELVDWSEPNALLGSFRCATMPLTRAS